MQRLVVVAMIANLLHYAISLNNKYRKGFYMDLYLQGVNLKVKIYEIH